MAEFFDWAEAPRADFAVIGNPVSHSKSPRMHQAAYDSLGLKYRYVAILVEPSEVSACLNHLSALGYRGVNVTVPHKAEALKWCESVSDLARLADAVNTIDLTKRHGINTDGPGFVDSISSIPGEVFVCGAGGSARAIVIALADAGRNVRVWNRTAARALDLASYSPLITHSAELEILNTSVVVNATSSSLAGDSLAIDWPLALPGTVAYDLMYQPGLTPFLRDAATYGLTTMDGRELLAAQGALAFEFWLGPNPLNVMQEALGLE